MDEKSLNTHLKSILSAADISALDATAKQAKADPKLYKAFLLAHEGYDRARMISFK